MQINPYIVTLSYSFGKESLQRKELEIPVDAYNAEDAAYQATVQERHLDNLKVEYVRPKEGNS